MQNFADDNKYVSDLISHLNSNHIDAFSKFVGILYDYYSYLHSHNTMEYTEAEILNFLISIDGNNKALFYKLTAQNIDQLQKLENENIQRLFFNKEIKYLNLLKNYFFERFGYVAQQRINYKPVEHTDSFVIDIDTILLHQIKFSWDELNTKEMLLELIRPFFNKDYKYEDLLTNFDKFIEPKFEYKSAINVFISFITHSKSNVLTNNLTARKFLKNLNYEYLSNYRGNLDLVDKWMEAISEIVINTKYYDMHVKYFTALKTFEIPSPDKYSFYKIYGLYIAQYYNIEIDEYNNLINKFMEGVDLFQFYNFNKNLLSNNELNSAQHFNLLKYILIANPDSISNVDLNNECAKLSPEQLYDLCHKPVFNEKIFDKLDDTNTNIIFNSPKSNGLMIREISSIEVKSIENNHQKPTHTNNQANSVEKTDPKSCRWILSDKAINSIVVLQAGIISATMFYNPTFYQYMYSNYVPILAFGVGITFCNFAFNPSIATALYAYSNCGMLGIQFPKIAIVSVLATSIIIGYDIYKRAELDEKNNQTRAK